MAACLGASLCLVGTTGVGGRIGGTETVRAAAGDVGYRDFSWQAPGVNGPTAEKPQSKLWINDGSWWADMFDTATGRWEIYQLDMAAQRWTTTGTAVDPRPASWADALWDGTHLYVASAGRSPTASADSARLYRFSYSSSTRRYTLDAGFPVQIVSGGMEAIVLDRDSTGRLWATWTRNSTVYIDRTTGSDKSWGAPFVPKVKGTSVSPDDISAVISFSGHIGVMWSNQVDDAMYFATHADGEPDTRWSGSQTAIQGPKTADDHISLRSLQADPSGQVFAAVKTSLGDLPNANPNMPLIMLLVRDATGTWTSHVFSRVGDDQTRPIVMIDNDQRLLYIFATTPTGGGTIASGTATTAIYYKATSLSNIAFADGQGTPFIMSTADTTINNATSTKQTVDRNTGVVVLSSDNGSGYYLHNEIPPGVAPQPTPSPTPTPTPTPSASATPTPTPSATPTPTPSATPTPTPTSAASPTPTPTSAASPTPTPIATPTPTPIPTPSPSYAAVVAADSPTAYWRLGETSGSTAFDSAGTANGTLTSGVTTGTPGALANDPNTAMTFDGSSGAVAVPDRATLDPTADLTIEAWAKPTALDGLTHAVIHKGSGTGSDSWQYRLTLHSTGQWRGCVYVGTSGQCALAPTMAQVGTWTYLALVRTGGSVTLFVNGVAVAAGASTGTLNQTAGDLAIGRIGSVGQFYFSGAIDEAAVYSHALSASQIAAHYQAGTGSR